MNVTDVNENNYFFENLAGGDVFRYHGTEYYIKLAEELWERDERVNAVGLEDGTAIYFRRDDAVERLCGHTLRFGD